MIKIHKTEVRTLDTIGGYVLITGHQLMNVELSNVCGGQFVSDCAELFWGFFKSHRALGQSVQRGMFLLPCGHERVFLRHRESTGDL